MLLKVPAISVRF